MGNPRRAWDGNPEGLDGTSEGSGGLIQKWSEWHLEGLGRQSQNGHPEGLPVHDKIIGTPVKKCKIFISRDLDHHWPKLQLVSEVGLTNKGCGQSLREFAVILPAELSRVQWRRKPSMDFVL
ncbi:hypothetical protein AVEN_12500-1 [Araneus ventricosus]|uniref:Uncharacterized protein n=1 Tax=Araneus ventricosus TaxID=182803 RepID=A0A4Y2LCX3_ARAVE|nr:hypothetical protein AVEN_12500-1 [Araneus ventricosus]